MSLLSLIFGRESLAKRSGFCNKKNSGRKAERYNEHECLNLSTQSSPSPPSSRGLASILTEAESQSMLDL